jgi:uncharacterized protein (TIGR03435 family)
MNAIARVILSGLLSFAALAQDVRPRAEFEVASIRASADQNGLDRVNVGLKIDGAQVRCTYMALKDYIGMAYDVEYYRISGSDWLASQRFDIVAKLPAGTGRAEIPAMLATLLAERFHLKVHRETKDFPVYGLVLGKGELKLKESQIDSTPAGNGGGPGPIDVAASGGRGGVTVNLGPGTTFTAGNNRIECRKLTMASFVVGMTRFLDRPAVDMTGLTKSYDFTLSFSPEDFSAMMVRSALAAGVVLPPQAMKALEYSSGDSLFNAVQAVGLKLESRKAPLEVVVVDHVDKTPTEN